MKDSLLKKILKSLGFSREKKYLRELINNMESLHLNDKKTTYTVYQTRQRGFVAKVGGLFAFVSFKHMPWHYPNSKHWNVVARHLIGKKFYCKIHKLKRKPLLILLDGKEHLFREMQLKEFCDYQAIILQKFKNGFLVDIGFHFQWEYGSYVGYMHQKDMKEETFLLDEGDEVSVRYNGYNTDKDIEVTDVRIPIDWYNGEISKLVGTIQDVIVLLNKNNSRDYIIKGKFKAITPATKEFYGEERLVVEDRLKNMKVDTVLPCKVMATDKENKVLIIKVLF